jgi:hypothetical protein
MLIFTAIVCALTRALASGQLFGGDKQAAHRFVQRIRSIFLEPFSPIVGIPRVIQITLDFPGVLTQTRSNQLAVLPTVNASKSARIP